jgi:uncharacterized protein (DUF433 family)
MALVGSNQEPLLCIPWCMACALLSFLRGWGIFAYMSSVVTSHSETLGGTPVFRGTRVPVEMIFECLSEGMTVQDILAGWPSITPADLQQAIVEESKA